jgi:hypothetical protein
MHKSKEKKLLVDSRGAIEGINPRRASETSGLWDKWPPFQVNIKCRALQTILDSVMKSENFNEYLQQEIEARHVETTKLRAESIELAARCERETSNTRRILRVRKGTHKCVGVVVGFWLG